MNHKFSAFHILSNHTDHEKIVLLDTVKYHSHLDSKKLKMAA